MTEEPRYELDRMLEPFGVPPEAERVWRFLLTNPNSNREEIGASTGLTTAAVEAATEALSAARLVQRSPTPAGIVAIDPTLSVESHVGRAERQLFDSLEALSALRAQIPSLADQYARGRASVETRPGIEIINSLEDIRRQIYLSAEGCKRQSLNLHRSTTAAGFKDSEASDRELTARGVHCRSIISADVLRDPEIFSGLKDAHGFGELFRTLPEVPTRVLICDRTLAVVAIDPDNINHGAMFLRVRSLIDLLVLLFDQMWSAADPIFAEPTGSLAPSGRLLRTLELLAIGTTDERIARTLGVGPRTIGRDIAELKAALGVSSRAEIVAAAVRRGWL